MKLFENRVPRKIFIPKRDEVTGGYRKLHSKELHNLYFSPTSYNYNGSRVKEDEMRRACSTNGEKRNAYRICWENQKERDH
jgi:hypothetical protein